MATVRFVWTLPRLAGFFVFRAAVVDAPFFAFAFTRLAPLVDDFPGRADFVAFARGVDFAFDRAARVDFIPSSVPGGGKKFAPNNTTGLLPTANPKTTRFRVAGYSRPAGESAVI